LGDGGAHRGHDFGAVSVTEKVVVFAIRGYVQADIRARVKVLGLEEASLVDGTIVKVGRCESTFSMFVVSVSGSTVVWSFFGQAGGFVESSRSSKVWM